MPEYLDDLGTDDDEKVRTYVFHKYGTYAETPPGHAGGLAADFLLKSASCLRDKGVQGRRPLAQVPPPPLEHVPLRSTDDEKERSAGRDRSKSQAVGIKC